MFRGSGSGRSAVIDVHAGRLCLVEECHECDRIPRPDGMAADVTCVYLVGCSEADIVRLAMLLAGQLEFDLVISVDQERGA